MACILHIETATEVCSVAVSKDSNIVFQRIELDGPSHASLLGFFVDEALKELRDQSIHLDAVAVSRGPGSYTGLRIGVSQAKGVCYALGIPLIAIDTLQLMCVSVQKVEEWSSETLFCPMIDARRMEVYEALYDTNLEKVTSVNATIVDQYSFTDVLADKKIIFFGNGSAKCRETLTSPNAIFVDAIYPQASNAVQLAEEAFAGKNFVDVAYFEPFYLKEFVATTPKNKVLPPQ